MNLNVVECIVTDLSFSVSPLANIFLYFYYFQTAFAINLYECLYECDKCFKYFE